MDIVIFYSASDRAALEGVVAKGPCECLASSVDREGQPDGPVRLLDCVQVVRVSESAGAVVLGELEQLRMRVGAGRLRYVVMSHGGSTL